MVKIRIEGKQEDISKAAMIIRKQFTVLHESSPYKNYGNSVYHRMYIDAEIKKGGDEQ